MPPLPPDTVISISALSVTSSPSSVTLTVLLYGVLRLTVSVEGPTKLTMISPWTLETLTDTSAPGDSAAPKLE